MNLDNMTRNELLALVPRLAWNPKFGCYTRNGFEYWIWPEKASKARFILFFDIDHLHDLNKSLGSQKPVDEKIKQVLSIVRKTDCVCAQWKSGDEFLIAMLGRYEDEEVKPEGLQQRLVDELAKVGMSATFVTVEVKSWDLAENVEPAEQKMYELKAARGITR